MLYLTVELYTEDGLPIEEIHPIVKRAMIKLNLQRLDQFENLSAEQLSLLKVPARTVKIIREEMAKKGYFLNGE